MRLDQDELPHQVVTICLKVHRQLGLGLPARSYGDAMAIEMKQKEVIFERDVPFEISYEGRKIDTGETIDFVVEDLIVLSIVAQESTGREEKDKVNAQLRFSGKRIGFLVNFHKADLRQGIRRLIVGQSAPEVPHTYEPGLQGLSRPARIPPPRKRSLERAKDSNTKNSE